MWKTMKKQDYGSLFPIASDRKDAHPYQGGGLEEEILKEESFLVEQAQSKKNEPGWIKSHRITALLVCFAVAAAACSLYSLNAPKSKNQHRDHLIKDSSSAVDAVKTMEDLTPLLGATITTRQKYSKKKKKRAEEEIAKALVGACENGIERPTWDASGSGSCRSGFSLIAKTVPPPPGCPMCVPGTIHECERDCFGYYPFKCQLKMYDPSFCTTDSTTCSEMRDEHLMNFVSLMANLFPFGSVFKALKIAKKADRLLDFKAAVTASLSSLKKKMVKNVKTELKAQMTDLEEDVKDEFLDIALEELNLNGLRDEADDNGIAQDFMDAATEVLGAFDVFGIEDFLRQYEPKEDCEKFTPKPIVDPPFDPTSLWVTYEDKNGCGPRGPNARATLHCYLNTITCKKVVNDNNKVVAEIDGCEYFAYTVTSCTGCETD